MDWNEHDSSGIPQVLQLQYLWGPFSNVIRQRKRKNYVPDYYNLKEKEKI